MAKYIKRKIILFVAVFCFFVIFFKPADTNTVKADDSHENAYLCCFVDDSSNSFKTQVIYSGVEVEYTRVSCLFPNHCLDIYGLRDNNDPYRVSIYNTDWQAISSGVNGEDDSVYWGKSQYDVYSHIDKETGKFVFDSIMEDKNPNQIKLDDINFTCSKVPSDASRPLTFPASNRTATSADINRAYAVDDVISSDFMNALIFINDGEGFSSPEELLHTAYLLVTSDTNQKIVNSKGRVFSISYEHPTEHDQKSGNTVYKATITRLYCAENNYEKSKSAEFNYMVKKGYRNCTKDTVFENGQKNNLNLNDCEKDTEYISWEHLYLEASVLYAEGITFSNQADLYSLSSFENSIVKLTRNLLTGIRGILQLYSFEDCVFNSEVRGSRAFVFGVYRESWSNNISMLYLLMSAISLSLITIALIKLFTQRQMAVFSPSLRVSLLEGIKDVIISIFFIAFAWLVFKLLMMLNYRFVDIFGRLVEGKSISDNAGVYSTLAALIYQFAFFVLCIYVNWVYILRGIMVPMLLGSSPLFIYMFTMGSKGKKITGTWFRELVGNIFLQSVHAFVYGFIIISTAGLRGIESIILLASFIPITSAIKSMLGIGGDVLLKAASNMTTASVGAAASMLRASGEAVGNVVGGTSRGGVNGGPVNVRPNSLSAGRQVLGGAIKTTTGAAGMGLGAGLSVALGGESGAAAITGSTAFHSGASQLGRGVSDMASGVKTTGLVGGNALANSGFNRTSSSGSDTENESRTGTVSNAMNRQISDTNIKAGSSGSFNFNNSSPQDIARAYANKNKEYASNTQRVENAARESRVNTMSRNSYSPHNVNTINLARDSVNTSGLNGYNKQMDGGARLMNLYNNASPSDKQRFLQYSKDNNVKYDFSEGRWTQS